MKKFSATATTFATATTAAAATPLSPVILLKRFLPARPPQPDRRATLRDLYTSGLVSVFRRDSVLRVWEPLREMPSAARTRDIAG